MTEITIGNVVVVMHNPHAAKVRCVAFLAEFGVEREAVAEQAQNGPAQAGPVTVGSVTSPGA